MGNRSTVRRNPLLVLQAPLLLRGLARGVAAYAPAFDVVHAQWLPSAFAAVRACHRNRIPLILTVRGTDFRLLPRTLSRWLFSKVDTSIVPSVQLQDELGKLPNCAPILIPNPVDEDKFRHGRESQRVREEFRSQGKNVVTLVARLCRFKDPLTLVEAIPLVIERQPNTVFLFVGDGPLEHPIRKRCQRLGISSYVRVLGRRSDVHDVLSISDAFVAISPVENVWSNTITEAMMSGVPCVISRAGYSDRVFQDGVNARLVEPADATSVAQGVQDVLGSRDLQETLRIGAYRLLKRMGFSRNEVLTRTIETYANAVNRVGKSGSRRKPSGPD